MKFLSLLLFFILFPFNAWGYVPHDYPAIYTHQIGCIFYFIALIIFLWVIVHNQLHKERGWRYLFLAVIFFIIWDLNILISRFVEAWSPSQTVGETGGWQYFKRYIEIEGPEIISYLGRFDFILLNIAMLFFYMGLREHLKEEEKLSPVSATALLPLLPILITEITGNVVFIVLSVLSLNTSVKLYRKDRENPLWHYMVWLSSTYLMFSITRSLGHILKNILIPTGNQQIWESLYLDAIGGSMNTSIRFLVAALTLFFIWIYQVYLKISEDKKKLETSVEERTILIEQLERDKMELRELDKLKSAFLANVSHELRTPMNAIIGYTELLLDRVDGHINEDQEKSLKKVEVNAGHLLQLINAILDVSKIESGKIELEIREIDLKWLINSIVPTFNPMIAQKGLTLTIDMDKNLPPVYGDEGRIRQIMINLLSNAVKFTNKGGITIHAKPSGHGIKPGELPVFAEICVEDTGIGIRKDDLNKIFEKFVQIDFTLVRQYEGAGLGLSIVKGMVELHKGKIWVKSIYGEGSKFCFTLPLKKELLEKHDRDAEEQKIDIKSGETV